MATLYSAEYFVRFANGQAAAGSQVYFTANQSGATPATVTFTNLATLYSDTTGNTPVANPVVADSTGRLNTGYPNVQPYAALGLYTVITVFNGQILQVENDFLIGPFTNVSGQSFINVQAYGAKGAGFAAPLSGGMVNATFTLTLSTSIQNGNGGSRFSPGDVGYEICVPFAGPGSVDLYTTIAAYISPTQVTLAAANQAGKDVNSVDVFWWPAGSDDTAAIQTALNAASVGETVVYFPSGVYPISAKLTNSRLLEGIIGDGRMSSWIVARSTAMTQPIISFTDVPWGFKMSGLGCKGRGQVVPSGTENCVEFLLSLFKGIVIADIDNCRMLDSPGNALYVQCMVASSITNCLFDDCNSGFYADINPVAGFGGTSITLSGCYSYDMNLYAYYLNNYAYCTFDSCAADSNNLNYWVNTSENIVFSACGAEVALGHSSVGYGIEASSNVSLLQCYWTNPQFTDGVAVTVKSNSKNVIIDGFFSNSTKITPLVDINIAAGSTNTIIRNLNSTAVTPISDAGTGSFIQSGNEVSSAVLLDNIGNSTLKGTLTMNSTGAFVPLVDLNNDLGSTSKRWANIYTGNLYAAGAGAIRMKNTGVVGWSSTTDPTAAADTGISRDSANTIFFGNGTTDDKSATVCASLAQMKRFQAKWGSAVVAGDFAMSSGFGASAAAVMLNATSRDQGGQVSIQPSGTTAANPTVTFTFHDGSWGNAPAVMVCRGDTHAPTTAFWDVETVTATTVVFRFVGTPTSGTNYTLNWIAIGT